MRYTYPCNIRRDEEGLRETGREGYVVNFPDVYGANTGGDTWDEAVEMAEDCLGVALSFYFDEDEVIPTPSPPTEGQVLIPVPPLVAAKLTINSAMREKGITKEALGKKLGLEEDAVRKLLDPNYRTHLTQVERALRAVGRSLIVEDAPITEPARIPVVG